MSDVPASSPAAAPRRRRRSRLRSCLTLAPLLLVALLGGGEFVVRALDLVHVTAGVATPEQAAFYAAHMFVTTDEPGLGYRNRPEAAVTAGTHEYRHDERGRRAGAPRVADDAPGVAFLGDSTTYGWGVSATEALPAAAGARAGGAWRPVNLGVIGYGTTQEAALYEAERTSLDDERVRVVVLVFYPNDTVGHSFRWDDVHGALYVDALPVPEGWKATLWGSALYRGVASWQSGRLREAGELEAGTLQGIDGSLDALERLARAVAADGRAFVVAHLPGMVALDPYPFDDVVARVRQRCERLGVPFVDLLPAFLARREREIADYEARGGETVGAEQRRHYLSRFWVDPAGRDQHLNAAANAVAGEALAAALAPILERAARR